MPRWKRRSATRTGTRGIHTPTPPGPLQLALTKGTVLKAGEGCGDLVLWGTNLPKTGPCVGFPAGNKNKPSVGSDHSPDLHIWSPGEVGGTCASWREGRLRASSSRQTQAEWG